MNIELAKAGTYAGRQLTPAMLADMAATFAGDVPVVIGHELADTMPAFGWVKNLKAEGELLLGEVELLPELEEAFAEGSYRTWSIGARAGDDGRWYLHHLAFLGAVPPRIKGLAVLSLADADIIECSAPAAEENPLSARVRELEEALAGKAAESRALLLAELKAQALQKVPAPMLASFTERAANFSDTPAGEEALKALIALFQSMPSPALPNAGAGRQTHSAAAPDHRKF